MREIPRVFALRPRHYWSGWMVVVCLVTCVAAAGCGSSTDAVDQVALRFYDAVARGRGAEACALLAPETLRTLEQSAGQPCSRAVLAEEIPRASELIQTRRFGNQAQVRLDQDVAFLAEFAAGWRVVAVGCTARKPLPYDCEITGG